jgi:predicted O-methyltransferase YrrM
MTSTLDRTPVADCIQDLYEKARAQRGSSSTRPRVDLSSTDASPQERADAASDIYMPISPTAGRLVYSLIRAAKPTTVLEFGMSYGISTLHLAAAVRDNGSGRVVTTELSAKKIAAASQTFAAAGLDDVITILEGDALTTLAGLDEPIGFVLLDGWKEMYLPVIHVIERRLRAGALILADNASKAGAATYLDYVRDPANGYTSVNFPAKEHDSMELSCRL